PRNDQGDMARARWFVARSGDSAGGGDAVPSEGRAPLLRTGSTSLRGPSRQLRFFGDVVLVALAYYLLARLGLAVGSLPGNVAPVWPSSGFALAVLLRRGRGFWPGVALGALAVNAFGAGVPLASALGMAAGNTVAAVGGVTLLRRAGFRTAIDRTRDVVAL